MKRLIKKVLNTAIFLKNFALLMEVLFQHEGEIKEVCIINEQKSAASTLTLDHYQNGFKDELRLYENSTYQFYMTDPHHIAYIN